MSTTENFRSGGAVVKAELFNPSGTPNGGVIVIAYGSDGMQDPWGARIRAYAEALSEKGFIAMIPDYFTSTNTKPGPDALLEIPVRRDTWQAALLDAVTHAKTLPNVQALRVGLLGFSLGGHLCLRLRESAKVLVEFFAPEFPGLDNSGSTTKLKLQAQIHHGLADDLVHFHPNADNVNNILQKEGATVELFLYPGAVHGFIGNDANNMSANKTSMDRTLSFFVKYL
jgi:dienelactone hydrolase